MHTYTYTYTHACTHASTSETTEWQRLCGKPNLTPPPKLRASEATPRNEVTFLPFSRGFLHVFAPHSLLPLFVMHPSRYYKMLNDDLDNLLSLPWGTVFCTWRLLNSSVGTTLCLPRDLKEWLMIAFITCNSHLVPLLEGLCSSDPCRFEFSVFWVFAGIEPTTSALTVPPSEKYIAIHMLSNFAQHIKFLTQHIIVLHSLDNIWKFPDNVWHVFDNIDLLCNYHTTYT